MVSKLTEMPIPITYRASSIIGAGMNLSHQLPHNLVAVTL